MIENGINMTQTVKIVETDKLDPEFARTFYKGLDVIVESGINPSHWSMSWPYVIEPTSGEYLIPSNFPWEYGDYINFYTTPPMDTPIGTLVANAVQGQPDIYISSLVDLRYEWYLKIGNETYDYKIKSIEGSKITLWENLKENKYIGDYLYLRVYILRNWYIYANILISVAMMTSGSTNLPANYNLCIDYYHKTTPTSNYTLNFGMCYKY